MRKFIVPIDVTVHTVQTIESDSLEHAMDEARDNLNDYLVDLNGFEYNPSDRQYDFVEQVKDDTIYYLDLEHTHPIREVQISEMIDDVVTVGPESLNDENDPMDVNYYCYVPDDVFWYADHDEVKDFINTYID